MTVTPLPPVREELAVDQRGRSELEFLRSLRTALVPVRERAADRLAAAGVFDAPFTTIEELRGRTDALLEPSGEFRVMAAALRWARDQATPRSVAAFERLAAELEPLAVPAHPERLQDRLGGRRPPAYWSYEFHGTAGGWDGHPHMGFVHHELVYRHLLRAAYGDGIFEQRRTVAAAAPRDGYRRILDLGCGTGQYTALLAETYPDAAITGVDLSLAELRYALRRGEDRGAAWTMLRAPAEDTGLPDASFDLVTSFILLHEVPPGVTRRLLAEAFRMLEPGGHVHFSDVTPYQVGGPRRAWAEDWDAEHGNEPWWRTAACLDLEALAREAGFVEVTARGVGPRDYPWVLTARRPGGGTA